jgi:hypothetical protein
MSLIDPSPHTGTLILLIWMTLRRLKSDFCSME